MKTASALLFLTISWAALLTGRCYAAATDDGKFRQNPKAPSQRRDHSPAAERDQPRSHASLGKANRPKQVSKNREPFASGTIRTVHQSTSPASNGSVSGAPTEKHALSKTRSVEATRVSLDSVLSHDGVRHHSPNPATVGGPPGLRVANTGAINGTRVSPKP
jgi:hypothetical protein